MTLLRPQDEEGIGGEAGSNVGPCSIRQPFDGIQDTGAHLMVQHHAKETGCHEKHDQDAVCKSQGSAVAGKSSVQVLQVLAHQLVQACLLYTSKPESW